MPGKPNPLTQGIEKKQQRRRRQPTASVVELPAVKPKTYREGRVLIAAHFATEVQIQLKVTAAEERTTVQALLAEGINVVFAKRGKPEIAELEGRE